jgi:hypothetical protein
VVNIVETAVGEYKEEGEEESLVTIVEVRRLAGGHLDSFLEASCVRIAGPDDHHLSPTVTYLGSLCGKIYSSIELAILVSNC